jgi:hypothetical protein
MAHNSRDRLSVSKYPRTDAGVVFDRTSVKPHIEVTSKIVRQRPIAVIQRVAAPAPSGVVGVARSQPVLAPTAMR